ncbi:hypothetical protein A3C23_01705 [Candidatus Roizmanbacteria bacterium RIFCSPHIGHO2_02_FULL_37_13b]|uniref:Oxidoreductase n=1 Tax=Candidatus Roizmanbacteria bacterium RIFCSPLOWO2_02_FULL_36_11 TaxID=1802071 RepID=A0A1F7JCW3_9BACT|nr:MAG: hypothetical protein A3C23_01705 [Candidatus Roizmanbacteria bacterium RIFCSPHIGHO2_02_FULL_37_13b]OGK53452.1 MAG: hypothetical protein A3H78_02865 [Candidatus Roizmanbacteria bacterium RIFCSPLOWO2_02_FULL_36_11]
MKKVAIIGAGLQAERRIGPIANDKDYKIAWIVGNKSVKAKLLAKQYGANYGYDWRSVVIDKNMDVIVILTYPNTHAEISITAMKNGKDVLCEKPLARTEKEAQDMIRVANKTKRILKCGFNHRHHPAIIEAYNLFKSNLIGKPVFGRGRYGIAGREGLEKEWRSNPTIVSGGQLMEQGIHLVDLFRWFFGDVSAITGFINTNYWKINPLEDNGFGLLQMKNGVVVSLHSSLTQWINLFEFEIYGEKGSLTVKGLGGAYGTEKLIINQYDPNGPFSYNTIEYRGADRSWEGEWKEFSKAVITRTEPLGNGLDGLKALEIVNSIYKASKTGRTVNLER